MPIRRERWTRLDVKVKIEAPRGNHSYDVLFVSPGGMFVPKDMGVDAYTQLTARFTVEERPVVAHLEVRRILSPEEAQDRGIDHPVGGTEMRIVRMEGDGSVILAEHIKKVMMESGGPTG
jgi:hypothetical protein